MATLMSTPKITSVAITATTCPLAPRNGTTRVVVETEPLVLCHVPDEAVCAAELWLASHGAVHPEMQYKKPHFQYNLYQECGFLSLILQRSVLRARAATCGTDAS
eukprot:3940978-Rhodomonas_salina.3